MQALSDRSKAQPPLKWVGGKRALLPEVRKLLPEQWEGYWEPFVGGGALFFDLRPDKAELSDVNPELIATYRALRDSVEPVIDQLRGHAEEHVVDALRAAEGASSHEAFPYYYAVRAQAPEALDDVQRAARMLYLNRTCFNGLYRVNRAGRFNVPAGRYSAALDIVREDVLRQSARALAGAHLAVRDFTSIEPAAGDLVYLDPPYDRSEATSFTQYAAAGFGPADQGRVCELACRAVDAGATVLVSNHDTKAVRELYDDGRFQLHAVRAPRRVGAKSASRQSADELVILGRR